ncbi:hypothetical protein CWC11_19165 [Pseudoalteromonas sp. S3178]|nr:hypothetical protein CWC11_19165 [Pseudoalteromonas sp. S3178]
MVNSLKFTTMVIIVVRFVIILLAGLEHILVSTFQSVALWLINKLVIVIFSVEPLQVIYFEQIYKLKKSRFYTPYINSLRCN